VKDLGNQLPQLGLGLFQGGCPLRSCPVVLSLLAAHDLSVHDQVTGFHELVEHRVKRPRADVVAVAPQLPHHPDPEDRLLHGVVEDVHPHEPAEKHLGQQLAHAFRPPILTPNIKLARMVEQVDAKAPTQTVPEKTGHDLVGDDFA
jgi:hypothetical protein